MEQFPDDSLRLAVCSLYYLSLFVPSPAVCMFVHTEHIFRYSYCLVQGPKTEALGRASTYC